MCVLESHFINSVGRKFVKYEPKAMLENLLGTIKLLLDTIQRNIKK